MDTEIVVGDLKLETIFMVGGDEYKVTYIDIKKKRCSIEPHNHNSTLDVGTNILLNGKFYSVLYKNEGKKRLTIKFLET